MLDHTLQRGFFISKGDISPHIALRSPDLIGLRFKMTSILAYIALLPCNYNSKASVLSNFMYMKFLNLTKCSNNDIYCAIQQT